MNTVDLLWRRELPAGPRRGRPPKLTHDQVVTAAVAVADRIGIAFTLRHVAEALGVPVMSLYSYVDGREQLLELMVDDCRATMAVGAVPVNVSGNVLGDGDGDWRARLTVVADDNLALFADHPWLADIESERAVLGPGTLAKYERELTAVESLAVGDVEKDAALSLVLDFTRSAARAFSHAARERDGETPEDWRDAVLSEIDYAFYAARETLDVGLSEARAYMLRSERWKYVYYRGFPPQLFDLKPRKFFIAVNPFLENCF